MSRSKKRDRLRVKYGTHEKCRTLWWLSTKVVKKSNKLQLVHVVESILKLNISSLNQPAISLSGEQRDSLEWTPSRKYRSKDTSTQSNSSVLTTVTCKRSRSTSWMTYTIRWLTSRELASSSTVAGSSRFRDKVEPQVWQIECVSGPSISKISWESQADRFVSWGNLPSLEGSTGGFKDLSSFYSSWMSSAPNWNPSSMRPIQSSLWPRSYKPFTTSEQLKDQSWFEFVRRSWF